MTPEERYELTVVAHRAIARAIKRGDIPKAIELQCKDCGKAAVHYDHRDYRKPLEVDPVCKNCHNKRGPGLPKEGRRPIPNPTSAYSLRMAALIKLEAMK